MKLTTRIYQHLKFKNYLKKKNLLFFFSGFSQNSDKSLISNQSLDTLHFKFYKVFNKVSKTTAIISIFRNFTSIMWTVTPLMVLKVKKPKKMLFAFKSVLFDILAIKLNNKIYQAKQLRKTSNLFYYAIFCVSFKLKWVHIIKSK